METTSIISLLVLSTILVFQQFFYLRQIHKLIDKLMCRSLSEYTAATTPQAPKIKIEEYADNSLGAIMEEIRI